MKGEFMNTFIFDLDGTLLPMPSQEQFLNLYFKALTVKMAPYNINPKELMDAVMAGTMAMVKNDGKVTNEHKFWNVFSEILGEDIRQLESVFEDFYQNEFSMAKEATHTNPYAKECIELLKSKGYHLVLATNPLFPRIATYNRIQWAGLNPEDFEYITTYENSSFCKPNLEYYRSILRLLHKKPEECMMIGNDVREDMCAAELGMSIYLLKDCLICPEDQDISGFTQGSFEDLLHMIRELPQLSC